MIGENQGQRSRHQPGNAIRVDVHGGAQPQLRIGENFPPIGIEHNILARAEEGQRGGEIGDGPDVLLRVKQAESRNGGEQQDLRHQHPAAPPAEKSDVVAIHHRRPEKFPGVRQLDQGKQSDGLQVHVLGAQPGGNQTDENEERQTGTEAGKNADQHAPRE